MVTIISRAAFGVIVATLAAFNVNILRVDRCSLAQTERPEREDSILKFGNVSYLAHVRRPKAVSCSKGVVNGGRLIPITVIRSRDSVVTGDFIESTLANYTSGDDVFSDAFLKGVYVSSTEIGAPLDISAVRYLESIPVSYLFLDSSISFAPCSSIENVAILGDDLQKLPPGPYVAESDSNSLIISAVSRLYEDVYRDFLFGVHATESGDYTGVGLFNPDTWFPYIPVPSRIYSWGDSRPLAGERVAIKDLFDLKGTQTSAGSKAYREITPIANTTAPSIQRIIDLGGVIVGKQKLAQFASGAFVWDWHDQHYPWNPRGDGWQSCSASSSGGGCSIAAYDWLDFAIGSDTSSSMREPAAVAGVYGGRPSQGIISLEGVFPLSATSDTAGVFSRDPKKWSKFSKLWYAEKLRQDSSITGLSPLEMPHMNTYPKRILYTVDYLPLTNPAAETILQAFIANLTRIFDMKVEPFNMSLELQTFSTPLANDFATLIQSSSVFAKWSTWLGYGHRLVSEWATRYDGRYPPLDPANRNSHWESNLTITQEMYNIAQQTKREGVEWYERHIQYSTKESCSESILLHDIGTGGLPSYREQSLNVAPNASLLAVDGPYDSIGRAGICPAFGCADFTVPIGQVPYWSEVTRHEEMVPVTINMVVKRGCDFVLMNMIERLADEGVLRTVKTGRTPF